MVKALLFAGGCPKAIFLHLIWINCSDLTTTSPRVLCLPSSDVFHADLQQKVPPTQRIDLREIRHPWVFTPRTLRVSTAHVLFSAKTHDISNQKGFSIVLQYLPLQMNTELNTCWKDTSSLKSYPKVNLTYSQTVKTTSLWDTWCLHVFTHLMNLMLQRHTKQL
jgi:hypothetical protein